MKKIVILLIASMSMLLGGDFKVITFEEAMELHKQNNVLFVDSRPEKLFKLGTILGAINVNMNDKDTATYTAKLGMFPADKSTKIVSFCNGPKCMLSHKLAKYLQKDGYTNIVVYAGGSPEWIEKKAPSMGVLRECQADVAAYVPKEEKKVVVNGVTLYKGADDGMVDQRWFSKLISAGEVSKDIVMVDVREVKEYNEGHYPGAISAPYNPDKATLDFSKLPKDKVVVFYCYTGMKSVGAWQATQANKIDTSAMFYIDAKIDCKDGKCTSVPNDDL